MSRILPLAVAWVVLLAAETASAQGYELSASSTCTTSDSVYVTWATREPPGPNLYPDWIGYDVFRRGPTECSGWESFVRVNAEIIPREVGLTHTRHFGEQVPATGTTFEYWVRAVDANREFTFVCCGLCLPCNVFENCPPLSAPITTGTLEDWGWTLAINPCPGSCDPGGYLAEPTVVDQLRPYVGTSATFRFFGTIRCGTVEGCSLSVDHWEFTTCVTPVAASSWGWLKTTYR